ncbi:MAG: hypothetical protein CML42_05700 [Rhodobacteraceae bacterium]|nr:hypothetical protein [Paracoccaceae bacterium]|tara:strand:- start:405 stop:674 length:270 start_codon:yes stop_codon:yes gene_type:complete
MDKDLIINFLAGGILIAICGFLSKHYGGYVSGLLYGSMPLAAYYLYFYSIYVNKNKKNGFNFINGSIIGGILWVMFIALLYPLHYMLFM